MMSLAIAAVSLILLLVQHLWLRALRRAAVKAEQVFSEQMFSEGTRLITEQLTAANLGIERALTETEEANAKCQRYFRKIEEALKERDDWRRRHYEEAINHGNAQAIMMGLIEEAGRKLASKNIHLKLPPVLQAVREEHLTYEQQALEGTAELQKAAPPTDAPVEPS